MFTGSEPDEVERLRALGVEVAQRESELARRDRLRADLERIGWTPEKALAELQAKAADRGDIVVFSPNRAMRRGTFGKPRRRRGR